MLFYVTVYQLNCFTIQTRVTAKADWSHLEMGRHMDLIVWKRA